MTVAERTESTWIDICALDELVPQSGVAALVGKRQVALFLIPHTEPSVYAIGNWDPLGQANVLSRGILGDLDGEPVVASPLNKQHYRLRDGQCLENSVSARSYPVRVVDGRVQLAQPEA
ncbi:nitrite reductase small subunit NirD [Guyparkeria halopsychrophila]|uniref:nitrite reductase small subunit NirD n=1 Tax=Guyparkeria halopsychrophila TaxID=3139421 RepID=UPI0037C94622